MTSMLLHIGADYHTIAHVQQQQQQAAAMAAGGQPRRDDQYAALFVALIGEGSEPQGVVSTTDGRVVRAFHRFTLVDQSRALLPVSWGCWASFPCLESLHNSLIVGKQGCKTLKP